MTRYTDLSIHVRMAWNRQHILNGGPKDATVPGWFLRVTRNEGYNDVIGETQLSNDEVLKVAETLDEILYARGLLRRQVQGAVIISNKERQEELRARLLRAEAAAASIPALRAELGE